MSRPILSLLDHLNGVSWREQIAEARLSQIVTVNVGKRWIGDRLEAELKEAR